MDKNIKITKNNMTVEVKIYNGNGMEMIIWYTIALIVILGTVFVYVRIKNKESQFLTAVFWNLFVLYSVICIFSLVRQMSYNAFEKISLFENLILLKTYFFPWILVQEKILLENDENLLISFKNLPHDKSKSVLYKFFPGFFRKYSPLSLVSMNYTRGRAVFRPNEFRSMQFKRFESECAFGTMMSRESYDEILALILAQRAKWEKEHPEDATGHAPEDSETHTVDSPSQ